MSRYAYERLTALDNTFLVFESSNTPMHVASAAIFEAAPLRNADGGVDIDRIRAMMEAGMHRMPRYRQRLESTPGFGQPVWVDDAHFNLAYHVRHTHLPQPGDERQLKRLVGRVMSQELDRGKPLWETWVVEGLADGSFALITKAHHCMIDGVGSVELTGAIMRPTPDLDPALTEPPPRWIPRPIPTPLELFLAELRHRSAAPLKACTALVGAIADPRGAVSALRDRTAGIAEAVGAGLTPASPPPLNVAVGPHRRFDWTTIELAALKAVRSRYGGTVNDVVLSIVAGAIGRFLRRRGGEVDNLDFRVMVPINVRDAATQRDVGNRVAMMVVRLPLAERDAVRRLERTVEETRRSKRSHQALGIRSIEDLSDATFTTLMSEFGRLTAMTRPYNLIVTNVPGPTFPVYVAGARMTACYPLVPLFANQALGIALFSYDGRLYWGFNADWDALPDLHDFVESVDHELGVIRALGETAPQSAVGT
jgi:WS/DGAT/MGAT family acyltransferase